MSRSVKIYYGLSGSFKSTTIKQSMKLGDDVLWSGIKPWKSWEKNILGFKNNPSDLNFALLHLSRLKDREYSIIKENTIFHVERGISDMVFYWLLCSPTKSYKSDITTDKEDIKKSLLSYSINALSNESMLINLIEEEIKISKVVGGSEKDPIKVLLVQKDIDFIKNVVLKEETRSDRFPNGVEDYLRAQDLYVDFTKQFNKIDEVIEITNAKDYLKNLGIEYNAD